MKRRKFFKKAGIGLAVAGVAPMALVAAKAKPTYLVQFGAIDEYHKMAIQRGSLRILDNLGISANRLALFGDGTERPMGVLRKNGKTNSLTDIALASIETL